MKTKNKSKLPFAAIEMKRCLPFEEIQRRITAARFLLYDVNPISRQANSHVYKSVCREPWYLSLLGRVYSCLYKYGPLTQNECVTLMWSEEATTDIRSIAASRSIGTLFAPMSRMHAIWLKPARRACGITGRMVKEWDVTDRMPSKPEPVKGSRQMVTELLIEVQDLRAAGEFKDTMIANLKDIAYEAQRKYIALDEFWKGKSTREMDFKTNVIVQGRSLNWLASKGTK